MKWINLCLINNQNKHVTHSNISQNNITISPEKFKTARSPRYDPNIIWIFKFQPYRRIETLSRSEIGISQNKITAIYPAQTQPVEFHIFVRIKMQLHPDEKNTYTPPPWTKREFAKSIRGGGRGKTRNFPKTN